MRPAASPVTKGRNCQKASPVPARRRPWTPCITVAATRSATTTSGGSVAPSASARVAAVREAALLTTGPPSPDLPLQRFDHLAEPHPVRPGGEIQRHAV